MTLYNQNWEKVDPEKVDITIGVVEEGNRPIKHIYVVDVPGEYHEEVLKEYPNGGKDVEIVWDVPESGHWETYDEGTGSLIEGFDNSYLDANGYNHDLEHHEVEYADVYRPMTDEELSERKAQIEEFEAEQKRIQENTDLVESMPELLCAMYEENLALQKTVDQQEEVLCAMYEELIQVKDTSTIAYAEAIRPY